MVANDYTMTNGKSISMLIMAIGILSVVSLGATAISSPAVAGGSEQKFTAKLSGKEEVPPNDSAAAGWAWIKPMNDTVGYQVNVTDIDKVKAAHIHSGKTGENGPVVVALFTSDTPTEVKNGSLAQGNFTATDLEGPMEGKALTDLVTAMTSGETYVNVHSEDFPDGEIRGQLMMTNSTG